MHNNQLFAKTIIASSKISVSLDEVNHCLKIYSPATFFGEIIILLASLFFSCLIIKDNTTPVGDDLLFGFIVVLGLMFLFIFSLMKRSYLSVFDLTKGILFQYKGGIYSSSLDRYEQEIKLIDISNIGIQKFPRRYGDTFQVFLGLKMHTACIEITGKSLSLADAQLCAETVREFLAIKEKIDARD